MAWTLALATLVLPALAAASPGVSVDQYRPPASADDGMATQTPEAGPHLRLTTRAIFDYARKPLVFETARGNTGSTQLALVRDQLRLCLGASLSLWDRLLLFAGLPLDLVFTGSPLGLQPTATGFGAGDLALGARGFIWGNEVFRLGAQLSLTAPTGADGGATPKVSGDSGVAVLPTLLSELSLGPLRLTVEAGLRLRRAVTLPSVQVRDQLLFALALRLPLAEERLWLSAEVFGSTLSADVGRRYTTMLEALGGAKLHLGDVRIGIAGSKGLSRGYGVPELRALLSFAWVPRLDAAGSSAPVEKPAEEPTVDEPIAVEPSATPPPTAAAPEPRGPKDSDKDGWNDETDACPFLPAAESQSGCPELVSYDTNTGALGLTPAPTWKHGSAQLAPRNLSALKNLASALAGHPELHLLITSHLDPKQRRPPAGLGVERARALGRWLSEHGVHAEQLELYDCGTSRPANRGPRSNVKDERSELFLISPLPEQGMPSTLGCTPVPLQPTAATLGALGPRERTHNAALSTTHALVLPQAVYARTLQPLVAGHASEASAYEPGSLGHIQRTIQHGVRAP